NTQGRWLMRPCRHSLTSLFIVMAVCWLGVGSGQAPAIPQTGQQAESQATPPAPDILKSQSNLVLVDAIVTDRKGNYIRDLEAKDFKVYEDNKEQTISSFSKGSEGAAANGPSRSEEHTSELQSPYDLVCRLLLEKKKNTNNKD